MADGEDRAPEAGDIVLQPLGGVEIQVVGWLVQQEDVRILQDEAAQVDSRLLAAGEGVEEALAHVPRDGEAVRDIVHGDIGIVAAEGLEAGGEGIVAPEEGGVILPRRHALREALHLLPQLLEPGEGAAEDILHGAARGVDGDLGDEAHPAAGGDDGLALVGLQLAGEDPEEGALPRAVAAQEAHPLPLVDLEGDAVQDIFTDLEGLYQSLDLNINHRSPSGLPPAGRSASRGRP